MIEAAGILFQTPDGRVLLLRRTAEGDAAGEWALPGGKLEPGETAAQAAIREAGEEIGWDPVWVERVDTMTTLTRRQRDGVDYTTFLIRVPLAFETTLNAEHDDAVWPLASDPPQPLHPGVGVVLARAGMNELDVARAIASGELTSPQPYENMLLVAMRITGTGVAYRSGLDEFVWRNPEIYLNEDFLARCNGLPVIVEHPKGNALTSQEFQDRVVGTILLPYIAGDEVWGVAKIFDDATIEMVNTHRLSTSPAVVFRDPSANTTQQLEDGSTLLIEGKPSLLDHLAICEQGVWDKGRPPAGVASTLDNGGSSVDENEDKGAMDEKAKADAEAGQKLDRILSHMDAMATRLDALEQGFGSMQPKGQPEAAPKAPVMPAAQDGEYPPEIAGMPRETAADRVRYDMACAGFKADQQAKKDAAMAEEEKAKMAADAMARRDSEMAETRKKIDELEAKMPKADADADAPPAEMAAAQAKADSVYGAHGSQAPRALLGESLLAYRRRLADGLKGHSNAWKSIDLATLPAAALDVAASTIYADAMVAARNPADLPTDQLRPIVTRDTTGRQITSFVGQPSAWMSQFMAPRRVLTRINNGSR